PEQRALATPGATGPDHIVLPGQEQKEAIPMENAVVLDVRPDLEAGQEPFHKIMEAVDGRGAYQELVVSESFAPRPLYQDLGAKGFDHRTQENEDGDWRITFFRRKPTSAPEPTQAQ